MTHIGRVLPPTSRDHWCSSVLAAGGSCRDQFLHMTSSHVAEMKSSGGPAASTVRRAPKIVLCDVWP
jgi:hypothetical protein